MSETLEQVRGVFAERYVVDRVVGRGGMATVYLATDLKHDRKVALKVLRPELTTARVSDTDAGGDYDLAVVASMEAPPLFVLLRRVFCEAPGSSESC